MIRSIHQLHQLHHPLDVLGVFKGEVFQGVGFGVVRNGAVDVQQHPGIAVKPRRHAVGDAELQPDFAQLRGLDGCNTTLKL